MKKFFAILAAALLVVACGGNAKEEPKSIEDQLLDHVAKIEKAVEAGDVEASVEAVDAWAEWVSSLDEQQYAEYMTFADKHLDRIIDMITAYNYLPLGEYSFEQSLADECCDEEYDEWADEDDEWADEDYDDEDYEDYDDEDYDDEDYDDEDYDDEW